MSMTTTGEPLNLSAPVTEDTPGWVADFAGNARKTNDFALKTIREIGDIATLTTAKKESLVAALNEIQGFREGTLDTVEEIGANNLGMVPAGALALKEAINSFAESTTTLQRAIDALNSNIDNITNKLPLRNYERGYGSSFNYDFCRVGVTEEGNICNKDSYFYLNASDPVYNFSKFAGVPPIVSTSGYFIGYREVFWRTNKNILVKLTEMYPSPGRQHYRFYNDGTWTAWKAVTPS